MSALKNSNQALFDRCIVQLVQFPSKDKAFDFLNLMVDRLKMTEGEFNFCMDLVREFYGKNEDPSPWCNGCGAKKRDNCTCGPIAENE